MLSFEDAIKSTLQAVRTVDTEKIALLSAQGRLLREPVKADRDLPPFDRSERDGFAVRAEDCPDGKATLPVHERTIYAGDEPGAAIEPGTAVRIMTGAPLPEGANVAVPVEKTTEIDGGVTIDYPAIKPGLHVHPRGSDARAGALLLEAGIVLGPSEIAAAASVGAAMIDVSRRIRLSALSTGDELVAIEDTPGPAAIRDCNGPAILAMASAHPWIHALG
ncbi:MAG: molybdopterin molybdenumtransferase MoeA, partial [Gemmatimonadetes bacterium]|nr:molybdopterin molybdenumtransferase MoeA [Gemmatimonadota bacterium]